ncbi:hypothetical protein EMIHUDRAFT_370142 [Emiliania huxleyi CCMP1516]|uniref:Uncharacterized protein n=2 Tax=Emiliania huxleyi TaxID=2903 RepID=A0A0D3J0I2_EMIH1|nr:hypothetical protein EMIHUDRAFT_370142 [Emiliania huxleyi CCMP1516]EOD17017.1 hypothetical protein EMIHUDRAFT_370142 [Emiliania huxleyi CCMP1516]|eukprot:XP_005769446.1 hypothetical protein EMIHUDRAFT_370142 [Emiliania huxleyi CCMP1516]
MPVAPFLLCCLTVVLAASPPPPAVSPAGGSPPAAKPAAASAQAEAIPTSEPSEKDVANASDASPKKRARQKKDNETSRSVGGGGAGSKAAKSKSNSHTSKAKKRSAAPSSPSSKQRTWVKKHQTLIAIILIGPACAVLLFYFIQRARAQSASNQPKAEKLPSDNLAPAADSEPEGPDSPRPDPYASAFGMQSDSPPS